MDRRVLKYFLTVCAAGNITEAADRLYISRQALSLAITGAERELGATLFERSKRGVELTEQGERFYKYALAEAELWEQLQFDLHGEQGRTLRVGSVYTRLEKRMVEKVMDYRKNHPATQVDFVSSGGTEALWSMLEEGDCDVAVSGLAPSGDVFEAIKTRDCVMNFYMCDQNPLAEKDHVEFFSDLRGMTLLVTVRETVDAMESVADSAGVAVRCIPPNLAHMYAELQPDCVYPIYDFETDEYVRPGYVSRPVPDYPIRLGRYVAWRRDADPFVVSFARHIASVGDAPV